MQNTLAIVLGATALLLALEAGAESLLNTWAASGGDRWWAILAGVALYGVVGAVRHSLAFYSSRRS